MGGIEIDIGKEGGVYDVWIGDYNDWGTKLSKLRGYLIKDLKEGKRDIPLK